MAKLRVGVAGSGIVGGALIKWFENHTDHDIFIYDPPKGYNTDLKLCDAAFICVPVPTNFDGSQNHFYLENALNVTNGKNVFIRSTVLPGTNDRYGTWSCPEFLTERQAYDDTCKMGILTGCSDAELLAKIFPQKSIYMMSNKEAELAKYAHNAFGAMKVNFFNIIYDICTKLDADYKSVLDGVLMSGYINETHTQVPGPDGKFGFGGTCFPKDLKA